MRQIFFFSLWFVASFGTAATAFCQAPKTLGHVDRVDEALDQYIAQDAVIEVLASGFTWTEGPVWIAEENCLLFSDIPRNSVFRWSESDGISLFMSPSGYTGTTFYGGEPGSNGLALDPKGRLTLCEHGDRRVAVLTKGGGKRTLVDNFQGKRLNSPNDLVFAKDGTIYFTDPPYGLPNRYEDPRRELDFCGVYKLSTDGKLTLLTKEMTRPNGIGLSPDESTLYVAQSDPAAPIWKSFPIQSDGSLGKSTVLMNAKSYMSKYPGLPDGLDVFSDGTLFASGPGGIYVMTPAGKLLGQLVTGGRTSNCGFDADEKYLYITADDHLCRIKIK